MMESAGQDIQRKRFQKKYMYNMADTRGHCASSAWPVWSFNNYIFLFDDGFL